MKQILKRRRWLFVRELWSWIWLLFLFVMFFFNHLVDHHLEGHMRIALHSKNRRSATIDMCHLRVQALPFEKNIYFSRSNQQKAVPPSVGYFQICWWVSPPHFEKTLWEDNHVDLDFSGLKPLAYLNSLMFFQWAHSQEVSPLCGSADSISHKPLGYIH